MFTVALKRRTGSPKSDGKGSSGYRSHAAEKSGTMKLSEKRLPITTGEQRELRNTLNRLRDKYLAMGRYSDGIDSVILKVMKPNTSRRFFW